MSKWHPWQHERLRRLYGTLPPAVLSERIGKSARAISSEAKRLGLVKSRNPDRSAELEELALANLGKPWKPLAQQLGISESHLRTIAYRAKAKANAKAPSEPPTRPNLHLPSREA